MSTLEVIKGHVGIVTASPEPDVKLGVVVGVLLGKKLDATRLQKRPNLVERQFAFLASH
jgi:hypothetical protein